MGRADVYVNHETSTVPFPFNPATGVGFNDFTNAMVSKLTMQPADAAACSSGSYVIPSEANYQRFCSNFLAGEEHGFDRELLLTNEEATDFVNRTGDGVAGDAGERRARAGRRRRRLRREDRRVQVDLRHGPAQPREQRRHPRLRPSGRALGRRHVHPRRRRSSTSTRPHSRAQPSGPTRARSGRSGRTTRRSTTTATSPATAHLAAARSSEVPEAIAKGDQTALENWSNANNVFQFIRVEDIAYDRTTPTSSTSPTPASRGRSGPGDRPADARAGDGTRTVAERASVQARARPADPTKVDGSRS